LKKGNKTINAQKGKIFALAINSKEINNKRKY
jgi:hypothetical protein